MCHCSFTARAHGDNEAIWIRIASTGVRGHPSQTFGAVFSRRKLYNMLRILQLVPERERGGEGGGGSNVEENFINASSNNQATICQSHSLVQSYFSISITFEV